MIIHLPHTRDFERLHDDERRTRMLGFAVGLICVGAILVLLLMLTGCGTTANPALGPAALQASVSLGTEFGLEQHPEATPYVRVAAKTVCSAASGTNIAPADIVASLSQAGVTNAYARLIVNAALATYNIAYSYYGTNLTQFQPYATALCNGLTMGLPPEGGPPSPMMAKKSPMPHLK